MPPSVLFMTQSWLEGMGFSISSSYTLRHRRKPAVNSDVRHQPYHNAVSRSVQHQRYLLLSCLHYQVLLLLKALLQIYVMACACSATRLLQLSHMISTKAIIVIWGQDSPETVIRWVWVFRALRHRSTF